MWHLIFILFMQFFFSLFSLTSDVHRGTWPQTWPPLGPPLCHLPECTLGLVPTGHYQTQGGERISQVDVNSVPSRSPSEEEKNPLQRRLVAAQRLNVRTKLTSSRAAAVGFTSSSSSSFHNNLSDRLWGRQLRRPPQIPRPDDSKNDCNIRPLVWIYGGIDQPCISI